MSTFPERAFLEGLEMEIFKLVTRGATPEQWAEWLRAPLEHAAAEGNLGLVDKLIGAGANGSAGWKGCGGRTLLHAAAVGGNDGVVSSLLAAGCQPDVNVLPSAPSSVSALYMAADVGHEAVARLLIVAGANINFEHPEQKLTVLHQAIMGGHELLAKELIMRGADVNARTSLGNPPLHLAVHVGLEGLVSLLSLRGADKDTSDNKGNSALMCACGAVEGVGSKLGMVEALLTAGVDCNIRNSDGYSALDWASSEGYVSILQALLRRGVDVNSRDASGHSALHTAATQDQADAVNALIEAGADIEVKTDDGMTPLCWAARKGNANPLLALLQHGALVNPQHNDGPTPMHLACHFQLEGLEVVVDLLLRWGADETAVDEDGDTPGEELDEVHESRACSLDEIERVRLLLDRAPADRAWRRRGWLVMLRARASRARNSTYGSRGGAGLEGSNAASGGAAEGRKVARRQGGATGVTSGEQGQASSGVDGIGAGARVGNEVLRGAAGWLVGSTPKGVFRTVLEFL